MVRKTDKNAMRQKRHVRVRGKISGTPGRPRLNVYRSNANIYAQLIDDVNGTTLVSASTLDKGFEGRRRQLRGRQAGGPGAGAAGQGEGHFRSRLRPQRLCLSRPRGRPG